MKKFETPEKAIYVCAGGKCSKRGGKDIGRVLKGLIKDVNLKNQIEVIKTECTDRCQFAPVLSVQPANIWLQQCQPADAVRILQLANGNLEMG